MGVTMKPSVVSFAAVKGGVGKTRHAILTANCLGAMGKKVLLIDTDINNSSTYYYIQREQIAEAKESNNSCRADRQRG
jgi:cellulose biosynthesis protein BcsQ